MNPIAVVRLGDDYYASGANMEGGLRPTWGVIIFIINNIKKIFLIIILKKYNIL